VFKNNIVHNILFIDYSFDNLVFSLVKLDGTGYLEEEYLTFSIFCDSKSQIPAFIKKGLKHIEKDYKQKVYLLNDAKILLCERLFKSHIHISNASSLNNAITEFYNTYKYSDWTIIDFIELDSNLHLVYASRDWFNLIHGVLQDFNLSITHPISFARMYNSILDDESVMCLLDITNICIGYKKNNLLTLRYIKHSMFSELKIKKQKDVIMKINSHLEKKPNLSDFCSKRLKRIFDAVVKDGFDKVIFTSFLTKDNTELILKDLPSEIIELDKIGLIHRGFTDMMSRKKDLYIAQHD
jgi:hypothetical protein